MATPGEIFSALGIEVGDPYNSHVPATRLLVWLNRVLKEAVRETKCLWETDTISGLVDIEIVSYGDLSGDVISLETSADAAATDYTEGVEWTAATSNTVTATALATALDLHSNVNAYSDGAHCYVCANNGYVISTATSDADTDYITVTNGAEYYNLTELLTNFWQIEYVYDVDNARFYMPYNRKGYLYTKVDSESERYGYSYVPEGGKSIMKLESAGVNLGYGYTVTIDYLQKPSSVSITSTAMPGILDDYEDLIVKGILYYYYNSTGEHEKAFAMKQIFQNECRLVRKYLRMHGRPMQLGHLLRVAND